MRTSWFGAAIVLLAVALLPTAFKGAMADADEAASQLAAPTLRVIGTGKFPQVDKETLDDIRSIAQTDHISVERSVQLHAWQHQAEELDRALIAKYPLIFSSGRLNPSGEPGVLFRFTRVPPSSALAMIATLPVDSQVVTDEPYNGDQIAEINSAAGDATEAVIPPGINWTSVYKTDARTVEVDTDIIPGQSAGDLQDAISAGLADLLTPLATPPVKVLIVPGMDNQVATLFGGGKFAEGGSNEYPFCTTNFNVTTDVAGLRALDPPTTTGTLTARHCPDEDNYYDDGVSNWRYAFHDASIFLSKDYGDLQYHSTRGENVGTGFFIFVGTVRQAVGPDHIMEYSQECVFGQSTLGYNSAATRTCNQVADFGETVYYDPPFGVAKGLTATGNRQIEVGDSGGPYYYGKYAVGAASGFSVSMGRDYFTPVAPPNVTSPYTRMGVRILYNPQG